MSSTDEGENDKDEGGEAVAVDDDDEVESADPTHIAHSDDRDAPLDNKEDEEALRKLQGKYFTNRSLNTICRGTRKRKN
jgi:hypothetical protein